MQHTITKTSFFTSLDSRFTPCSQERAVYQMEKYQSDKGSVCALTAYTGKFSYAIGQNVDVIEKVEVNNLLLNNVIKNEYLNSYAKHRTL